MGSMPVDIVVVIEFVVILVVLGAVGIAAAVASVVIGVIVVVIVVRSVDAKVFEKSLMACRAKSVLFEYVFKNTLKYAFKTVLTNDNHFSKKNENVFEDIVKHILSTFSESIHNEKKMF